MGLEMDAEKQEHFRRTMSLLDAALAALSREHPDDWRERIRRAVPDEFEESGATVDDYLASYRKVQDALF